MIASPLRPPAHGRNRASLLPASSPNRGTPYGASLSFATTTHLWPPSDPPSRKLRSATSRTGAARSIPGRALASSMLDSPCQGSRTGLPPPFSASVPGTPARPSGPHLRRTPRASASRRCLGNSYDQPWGGNRDPSHTITEFAELFSVSRATIYREIKRARGRSKLTLVRVYAAPRWTPAWGSSAPDLSDAHNVR